MVITVQSIDTERLSIKNSSSGDAWISLVSRNRIDLVSVCEAGEDGKRKD